MNSRNYVTFLLLSFAVWMLWFEVQKSRMPARPRPQLANQPRPADPNARPSKAPDAPPAPVAKAAEGPPGGPPAPEVALPGVQRRDDLVLGERAPEAPLGAGQGRLGQPSRYRILAKLTNRGAAVTSLELPDYENESRDGPLRLVSLADEAPGLEQRPAFLFWLDQDPSLATKNWEVAQSSADEVVFVTTALGGSVGIEKRFSLQEKSSLVRLSLRISNRGTDPLPKLTYRLTGGHGLPIEGRSYTRYYRNEVLLLAQASGHDELLERTAAEIAKATEAQLKAMRDVEVPARYAGVATQYFASVVIPEEDPRQKRIIASVEPVKVEDLPLGPGSEQRPEFADITVQLASVPLALAPDQEIEHVFQLFNGPKDETVLAQYPQYGLSRLINYTSWFFIGDIAKLMVWVLRFFYSFTRDYGIAIILLTVLVRSCMFPLTFRQTRSMLKMQSIQPLIEELKEKYGNDKEKLARAQMELFRKHGVNPMRGCLPLFIQMPIFIGLYQSLQNSFNLRHSSFLYGWTWVGDLAAPDALFRWGPDIPLVSHFLGPSFNLLPILSVGQMFIHMKIMSPPATTPEAEMQQKMFKFMTVFMGFLFYQVPAGLCIYFITSGLWSMAERKLLPKATPPGAPVKASPPAATASKSAARTTGNGTPAWKWSLKRKGKARR